MPRPMMKTPEKSKNFLGSIKRLFNSLNRWRILLIVSFITPAARFANTKLSNKELLAKRLAP